jgi:hypothetical protein
MHFRALTKSFISALICPGNQRHNRFRSAGALFRTTRAPFAIRQYRPNNLLHLWGLALIWILVGCHVEIWNQRLSSSAFFARNTDHFVQFV